MSSASHSNLFKGTLFPIQPNPNPSNNVTPIRQRQTADEFLK
ncbi:MAG TPA: hypothetical protein VL357_04470 [Rariglobus sp.]|nr:hypothetical protein [Rariglobus sp.]